MLGVVGALAPAAAEPRWPSAPIFSGYVVQPPLSRVRTDLLKTATSCAGTGTTLEVTQLREPIPRHDQDQGTTHLVLRDAEGETLVETTATELWRCLAYDARSRRYLVTSENEHGVRVSMRGFVYVDEAKRTFVDSVLAQQRFEALAALVSPERRWVALIADLSDGKERPAQLYVLDLGHDSVRSLGKPPLPPALAESEWPDHEMVYPWSVPERHFTELEPGIWSFPDESTLQVSYGKDTYRARAKRRQVRAFPLSPAALGTKSGLPAR